MIVEKIVINRPSTSFLNELLIKLRDIALDIFRSFLDLAGGLPGPWFSWEHWWRLACFR